MGKKLNFEEVVREYSRMSYSLAYRIIGNSEDAEEIVQESFIKLHKAQDNFDQLKNLKNWVYTITLNTARDFYRSNKRKREIFDGDSDEGKVVSFEKKLEEKEQANLLLQSIPSDLREVVLLFYIESMSIKEIAHILNISESLVKVRLHRARNQMITNAKKDSHGM